MDDQKKASPNTLVIDLSKATPDPVKVAEERRKAMFLTTGLSTLAGAMIGMFGGAIAKMNKDASAMRVSFPVISTVAGAVIGGGIGYGLSKISPSETYEERAYRTLIEMKNASQTPTGAKENIIKMLKEQDERIAAAALSGIAY